MVGDATEQSAFWQTLAKRQGWTLSFSEHVFDEYRKFLYLALTSEWAITAPPPIRAAWDLHRELPSWRNLPEAVEIERRLSASGSLEETRTAYTVTFGQYPPESIWPNRTRPQKRSSGRGAHRIAIGLIAATITGLLAVVLPMALVLPAALGLALAVLAFRSEPSGERDDLERLAAAVAKSDGRSIH